MRTSVAATAKNRGGWPDSVRVRSILWGTALMLAGVLLLAAWMPGSQGMATGPRIGMGMLALTLGGLTIGIPAVNLLLRMRARPGDYEGRCPVGESCPGCGAFNLKPRQACRACGAGVNLS